MLHFGVYVDRFPILSKAVTIKLKKEQLRLLTSLFEQRAQGEIFCPSFTVGRPSVWVMSGHYLCMLSVCFLNSSTLAWVG